MRQALASGGAPVLARRIIFASSGIISPGLPMSVTEISRLNAISSLKKAATE